MFVELLSAPYRICAGLRYQDKSSDERERRHRRGGQEGRGESPAVVQDAAERGAKDKAGAVTAHHDAYPLGALVLGNDVRNHPHRCGAQTGREGAFEGANQNKRRG